MPKDTTAGAWMGLDWPIEHSAGEGIQQVIPETLRVGCPKAKWPSCPYRCGTTQRCEVYECMCLEIVAVQSIDCP